MTALGMPGVWTWNFGEAFGHHYLDSVAMNHNAIGRGYETFGNATAETLRRQLSPRTRPPAVVPPAAGAVPSLHWSARDNVNYTQTGALAALDLLGPQREGDAAELLREGPSTPGARACDQPPFAFVIPEDQGDRTRVAQMVGRLLAQTHRGRPRAGAAHGQARAVPRRHLRRAPGPAVPQLRRGPAHRARSFPKDGGEPYDDVSWELPAHYRLSGDTRSPTPRCAPCPLAALTETPRPAGSR